MCEFCRCYDFSRVGFTFADGKERPRLYFAGGSSRAPEGEQFRFCPVCGRRLTEENFEERVTLHSKE